MRLLPVQSTNSVVITVISWKRWKFKDTGTSWRTLGYPIWNNKVANYTSNSLKINHQKICSTMYTYYQMTQFVNNKCYVWNTPVMNDITIQDVMERIERYQVRQLYIFIATSYLPNFLRHNLTSNNGLMMTNVGSW